MDQQSIQMFVLQNGKKFDEFQLQRVTARLQDVPDDKFAIINSADYKDPTSMFLISLFCGGLGVDRFLLGDIGIGVLKLLTGGCFGILTIVDWFSVKQKTKEKNYEIFQAALNVAKMTPSTPAAPNEQPHNIDSIEQIKKYKQLLDDGVITEEEFDAKKRELL